MSSIKKHLIVSAPYRISLGGGGTDLPFYASKKGGELITGAINEYITVMVAKRAIDEKIFLQYSQTEMVSSLDQISHEILREILRYFKIFDSFQVATFSTMPTFTGLGASSTLIVALVKAIRELYGKPVSQTKLAEEAFHIEREILGLSGGFQDQYIAALGGIQVLKINKDLKVSTKAVQIEKEPLKKLQSSLFLIHAGIDRNSEKIIESQRKALGIIDAYDQIKSIGKLSVDYILNAEIDKLGNAMDDHWKIKKKMSQKMSNSNIDNMYLELKSFGSIGGKIIGAGGGGFFLMVVNKNRKKFKETATRNNYKFIDFDFEFKGAHIIK